MPSEPLQHQHPEPIHMSRGLTGKHQPIRLIEQPDIPQLSDRVLNRYPAGRLIQHTGDLLDRPRTLLLTTNKIQDQALHITIRPLQIPDPADNINRGPTLSGSPSTL